MQKLPPEKQKSEMIQLQEDILTRYSYARRDLAETTSQINHNDGPGHNGDEESNRDYELVLGICRLRRTTTKVMGTAVDSIDANALAVPSPYSNYMLLEYW
jgi:hypothetical protein